MIRISIAYPVYPATPPPLFLLVIEDPAAPDTSPWRPTTGPLASNIKNDDSSSPVFPMLTTVVSLPPSADTVLGDQSNAVQMRTETKPKEESIAIPGQHVLDAGKLTHHPWKNQSQNSHSLRDPVLSPVIRHRDCLCFSNLLPHTLTRLARKQKSPSRQDLRHQNCTYTRCSPIFDDGKTTPWMGSVDW